MERKKVTIELEVLTSRMMNREVEHDIDRLLIPLRKMESGQTEVQDYEILSIK